MSAPLEAVGQGKAASSLHGTAGGMGGREDCRGAGRGAAEFSGQCAAM